MSLWKPSHTTTRRLYLATLCLLYGFLLWFALQAQEVKASSVPQKVVVRRMFDPCGLQAVVCPDELPTVKFTPPARSQTATQVSTIAAKHGYSKSEIEALLHLLMRESGISANAVNKTSGACGLFQRLPCSVTLGDVEGQMANGLTYIEKRYGTATKALHFQLDNGWY